MKLKDLRALVSVSRRKWFISFDGKNNIAYGREGATDEEIIDRPPARPTLMYFVQKMPQGFATVIAIEG